MKKVLALLVVMVFVLSGSAFALLDTINNRNNSPEATANASALQGQNQNQGQAQGQLQGQLQGQGQLQTATAIQGQLGIVGQANKQSVSVGGDKIYSASYPAVGATEGVSSGTASSLFGSLGLANTEQYKKLMPQIQVISALIKEKLISEEDGQAKIDYLVRRMIRSNKTQRFLGIFWETDTKSIMNLLGLLSWDSIWDEGQNPFQSKGDMVVKVK